jgi:hypothetical protein
MEIVSAVIGAFLLYQLLDYLYYRFWSRNLFVDISFTREYAVEGEEMSLVEAITNKKILPLPVLQVKFMTTKYFNFLDTENSTVTDHFYRNDIVSVMMYQKLTKTLTFMCSHRGFYTINRMDVIGINLFLKNEIVKTFPLDIHLYVYPRPINMSDFQIAFQKMFGTVLTKRYINEDPFEFRNIREYQTYDNLKLINWKASAKTDSLKVNVHEYTSSQQVSIFLNMEPECIWRYEELEEESIRIASSFALEFINQGIPVSLHTNARDIITKEPSVIEAGSGANHIRTIQETLARIDLSLDPPAFVPSVQEEFLRASVNDFIIIISTYQKESLQQLLLSQLHARTEFVWIVPKNQDIKLTISDELSEVVIPWEHQE